MKRILKNLTAIGCCGYGVFTFFFIGMLFLSASIQNGYAMDRKDIVMRDYPLAVTLPKKRLEISADYLTINDTVDVFNVRDSEFSHNSDVNAAALGDMQGASLLINYGLFRNTTLQAGLAYKDLDYSSTSLTIKSVDFSVKQSLIDPQQVNFPFGIALDAGVHVNVGDDLQLRDASDINRLIRRFSDENISIKIDDQDVWFTKKTKDAKFTLGVPREGKPDPYVSIEDMQDVSPFIRLTAGKFYKHFFPNIFLEYGHTFIKTQIDSSLPAYFPDALNAAIPSLPLDLDREEDYLKAGANVMIKLPWNFMAALEYDYLKLFRGDDLDYIDYNHIVNADLYYRLTDHVVLDVGGTYYNRQLDGIVPFLYNKYSQTTFDHPYGLVRFGLTVLFGGE